MLRKTEGAIENLKIRKSPSTYSLGGVFYKAFEDQISPFFLHGVFEEAHDLNILPPFFLFTQIFISKSDDREKLRLEGSYRPISLMNVDYNIFLKILAAWLQSVIHIIVGPHQT